ncbi:LysM peptidoglycan-binding domain-containing protein [Bradymonadaceae bacterium TMQ3]|uniref:LysM peptidoglycan-binding domain-containing protein n=1 Tax=Lujinxingia sediminis TaxID=2480984 RepID=A0ABY0CSS1_9DELT|nr:penicillin-insensitive murein endopeptidase [Lujinxingia sediminis]RDV38758.1 LysM peptidoglycan-binding domain-containing protein [Bradymonadaceae bacterium TMQ3]RVU43994.1 LysM peptidoglycan-binding domain-containing protein [Lujinxingia sediminis]TXC76469.1 LysM peptidoglycan-binding domain-containing protein [Bradymonadales bacterium TMQ1]
MVQRRKNLSWVGWMTGLLVALSSSTALAADTSAEEEVRYHQLADGETLGTVAMQYQVGIDELLTWNDLESVHVPPETTLVVKSSEEVQGPSEPLPVIHVIRRGDTFEGIARRYGVTIRQVQRWNRRLNPRRLQLGAQVRLHIPGSNGKSVSWGAANGGRLYNGVAMQTTPGMRVRNVARSYGTQRVVRLLQAAGADVQARWPDAPDLVVGSLSVRNGGRLRPHRSHQSGRDVDLTYYHRGNVELPDFRDMSVEIFDAVKNWHLYKTLIDSGQVEFMFVDYQLQRSLYDYAISIGYTPEDLEPILQYPRGANVRAGIIRHSRGHLNHVHIRFTCGPEDRNCH